MGKKKTAAAVAKGAAIHIGIDAADRGAIAGGLSRLLADTYTLYLTTHNFHWNVTGPMFNSLHAMFMTQYTELWTAVDPIAERIRSLGHPAPGSYAQYAALASVPDAPSVPPKAMEMVQILVDGHEAVARTARAIFPLADKAGDEPTADLLTQRLAVHEQQAWMLRSLLEGDPWLRGVVPGDTRGMAVTPEDRANQLSELAPELASTVVRVAGDIALVIGDDGVIRSVAENGAQLRGGGEWIGKPWSETVGDAARQKVELLLQEAQRHGVSQRRELTHPTGSGSEIPVSWAAVRLGDRGPVLAVGRDLRAVSAIQQRFLDAQQELEREYWQRRQADARYRQLFQVANDAVVVIDAEHFDVIEANPAAMRLLGLGSERLHSCFEPAGLPVLDELLNTARASGRAAEVRLRVSSSGLPVDLSATPFRADGRLCLLLRARRTDISRADPQVARDFIVQTPDAVVVTDSAGRVLWANPAFVELCQMASDSRLRGVQLAEALGGDLLQWSTLLARVRTRGIVGQATVSLRPAGSPALLASVSAALLAEGDQEHIGITVRLDAATSAPVGSTEELRQDMGQLASHLGQLSLDELLGEASRMAELHFVQAAVRCAGGRIEAAAEILRLNPRQLAARMQALGLSASSWTGQPGAPAWPS